MALINLPISWTYFHATHFQFNYNKLLKLQIILLNQEHPGPKLKISIITFKITRLNLYYSVFNSVTQILVLITNFLEIFGINDEIFDFQHTFFAVYKQYFVN